jgi:hypothetical protein
MVDRDHVTSPAIDSGLLDFNKHSGHLARINGSILSRPYLDEENTGSSYQPLNQASSYIEPKVWTMHSGDTNYGGKLTWSIPNRKT